MIRPGHDGLRQARLSLPGTARAQADAAWRELLRQASERYRSGGHFARHFAHGKLGHDPVFRALIEQGAIAPGARVLDIGCGQALLASLLAACDDMASAAAPAPRWPAHWPAAPTDTRYQGIELMARDVARAQAALQGLARAPQLQCADMREADFGACDVAVILDVLHYVDLPAQQRLLERVRDALAPRGRLLLRVGDAARKLAYGTSQWVDRIVTSMRGHRVAPTWGRPLADWIASLRTLGFAVRTQDMSRGTPFANVLLVCDLQSRAP